MEELMACRICLATDVKLYDMCKYRLIEAFESLTGLNMTQEHLQQVCSHCGTMLNKFMLFQKKCVKSQLFMEHLLSEHVTVTIYHIKNINRTEHNLAYPYTLQFIQNVDSTIEVKEEVYESNDNIKSDIDIDEEFGNNYDDYMNANKSVGNNLCTNNDKYVNNCEYSENQNANSENEMNNSEHRMNDSECRVNNSVFSIVHNDNSVNNPKSDSDEEPLFKKVKCKSKEMLSKKVKKKKQKKAKKVLDCDKIVIKSEIKLEFVKFEDGTKNQLIPDNDSEDIADNSEDNMLKDISKNHQEINEDVEYELVVLSKEEQIQEVLKRRESSNYLNSVYKCESCYKGFMTESTYRNHMARHDVSAGPECCYACRTRWPDARALRAHIAISHERKYICKTCSHVSKSHHKAKEHAAWHGGATFPCDQCGATFKRSTSYLTHVRLRHPTATICRECGESFIGRVGLSMHRKRAHRKRDSDPSEKYKCESCLLEFNNKDALLKHAGGAGGACDTSCRPCVHCGDNLSTEVLLKEHLETHQTSQARNCSQCSRTFANERTLAAHYQRVHSTRLTKDGKPRACVCEICGYNCMSRSSLVQHQRTHSGEKPYECNLCGKTFSVLQRLQIHTRTHTGERPYSCSRCPKAFKHKAALNRHDRVHTGVKPYTCPQCGKSFSQSNSMKQHCAGVHMKKYIYSRRAANKQTS